MHEHDKIREIVTRRAETLVKISLYMSHTNYMGKSQADQPIKILGLT